jgi:hypothetical protein
LILSKGTLENVNCILALQVAVNTKKKVVLVWDTTSDFPQYSTISTFPSEIKVIFESIAVPLIKQHVNKCWKKVADKLFDRIIVKIEFKY